MASSLESNEELRVLVTGGAGYLGSAVYRELRRRGIEAFVVDDLSTGNRAAVEPERLHVLDILDPARLQDLMRDLRINAVLHFAARASVPDSLEAPETYWRTNLDGTRHVLEGMVATGARRLVLSSTAAVYRHGLGRAIREDDPTDPSTPYGASKLAAEHLARDLARRHGLTAVALRYFSAAGADKDRRHGEARRNETHIVPLLLQVALGQRAAFEVFGTTLDTPDGSCIRDLVSVQDLSEIHIRALTTPLDAPFLTCNVGSGAGVSVLQLLEAARRVTGHPIPHRPAAPRPGDPPALIADISLARRIFDWRPEHSCTDAILRAAWAWHCAHPNGYAA